ncbi:hypothetical protein PSACC_01311 [Paramicrosporidium saccamoebae]|uniref:Uncharacterized protein n=1 Tax=Paramicrosporidium saccamoebae TaxID=1246581 RepID=A0A2H9TME4_9FUNG|nr:hypothetical protein PSACC_01311 [Paramicrosporidium saccamoebae]
MDEYPLRINSPSPSLSLSFRRGAKTKRWYDVDLIPTKTFAPIEDSGHPVCIALDNTTSEYLVSACQSNVSIFKVDRPPDDGSVPPVLFTEFTSPPNDSVVDVSWFPYDNGLIISSSHTGKVRLWESAFLRTIDTIDLKENVYCHTMSKRLSTRHSSLAVAREHGVSLLDVFTGTAMQTLSTGRIRPRSLLWDEYNEFCLFGGLEDGSILQWDIRRPTAQVVIPPGRGKCAVNQLNLMGADVLVYTTEDGFLNSARSRNGELVWRSELEFECCAGFKAAIIDDTSFPMIVLPFAENVIAFNLDDGTQAWTKPCLGFEADSIVYNPNRSELYVLQGSTSVVHGFCI